MTVILKGTRRMAWGNQFARSWRARDVDATPANTHCVDLAPEHPGAARLYLHDMPVVPGAFSLREVMEHVAELAEVTVEDDSVAMYGPA